MALFGLSAGVLVVFAIILVALVLFATELVPVDITAIGVMGPSCWCSR